MNAFPQLSIFGFNKPKQADVISHWYTPVPHFNASTQEFYTAVRRELEEQKVPGMEISVVDFAEGGLLSEKRKYLRMTRERLVFDICAAPFGTNYFYSCRFAELPVKVSLSTILLLLLAVVIVFVTCVGYLGFFMTCFWGTAFLVFAIYALRNLISLGLADLDSALLRSPVFGPIYERFFRKETYYREDTRLMYLTVVEGIVKQLVDQETGGKGIKLLTQYEYSPILGELYKPSIRRPEETRSDMTSHVPA